MMKLLLPLLSFLIGNAKGFIKEPTEAITQQVMQRIRAITTILVSTVGALALGCVGLSLFIASIAQQLDKNEDFHISAGMVIYLIQTLLSAAVLVYSLRQETWTKALTSEEKNNKNSEKKSGALENAVALLIMDYIEERQESRTHKQNQETETSR